MRRSVFAIVFAPLVPLAFACGSSNPQPITPTPTVASTTTPEPPRPRPIPISAPEVGAAPESCSAYAFKPADPAEAKKACADAKSAIATLAKVSTAIANKDDAARDTALSLLSGCDRVPALLPDLVKAELAPLVCAEAILTPALELHKDAIQPHQQIARALVSASRLARLRPAKGAFDVLAHAEEGPEYREAIEKLLTAWRDAVIKEEEDGQAISSGTPPEIVALVALEAADAWIALANEIRATPLPDDLTALKKKDPDIETHYLAKLDESTMPIMDRALRISLQALGLGVRDGILLKELPSFALVHDAFKSRPGVEIRATRALDLMMASPPAKGDVATAAAHLPPWAIYQALERADPAALLGVPLLQSMAEDRGIPAVLRIEVEKDKKLDDAHRAEIALARLRVALSYGSIVDERAVASWKPKAKNGALLVAIAKALLGPDPSVAPKLGTPAATASPHAYDLTELDALAKQPGALGLAAAYDAALLSLDGAEIFIPDGSDPAFGPADQKKAYEAAIVRLDAASAAKGLDPTRAATAKKLADGARETVKLLK